MVLIDLKMVYDRVPREILCKDLENKGVWIAYIRSIKDMDDGTV